MHGVLVYLGRAARHVAAKNLREHTRQAVVILRWWAAPRYDFFIDTLTPLTLVDVVVLRHARRISAKWVRAKLCASQFQST
jgi:hypothetical protein